LKKTGGVTAVFFGDGATNTGSFHETANIAATWKLPLIFVCENNLFALSVPVEVHQNISSTASRAHGYEMRAEVVDGNDVLAVQDAAVSAVQLAREGMGPSFIECKTYRWRGHSEGDPLPPNLEEWKRRCPIARLKKAAAESGAADDAYWSKVEREVREEVSRAEDFAERSPFPSACEALEGVFATERSAACQ
jgi:TPP-dependent pyruvate/acetoin dehydrogenase alpha subunit